MIKQTPMVINYVTSSTVPVFIELFHEVVGGLSMYYNVSAINAELRKFCADYVYTQIQKNPKAIAIASIGERCIGFFVIQDQCGPIWLEWYGVHMQYRNLGAGRALIDFLLRNLLEDENNTKIWCSTRTNNLNSINLLKKMDFNKLCLLRNHWHKEDYFLWELMLVER